MLRVRGFAFVTITAATAVWCVSEIKKACNEHKKHIQDLTHQMKELHEQIKAREES